ncbi:hypothetical protein MNO14_02240 [Luteimonas sp. S4-F44]|uniref:hypothetical protein n=1 Tax=Luteimonas sp. S4-F44 TaxID=2925842 RepID=UPI001F5347CF|nr:hypothetical protein [Luteimonas sp. S4-F44]UNK42945.1 hypothetical protein MNO14_02240 [Luteimonas sp. S4-F44]
MRPVSLLTAVLACASLALPVAAQQLRNPADPPPAAVARPAAPAPAPQQLRTPPPPPPAATLRAPQPTRQLSNDVTRPVTPTPALSQRERCLQTARSAVQPVSDQRVAAAQRGLAATQAQRAATGAVGTDPTDRSGLREQQENQQRAIARERDAAAQQLRVAQANCN